MNILKDEFTKNPEGFTFTPPSQEEDIERAAKLSAYIEEESKKPWGYTPPKEGNLDEEWNPIY